MALPVWQATVVRDNGDVVPGAEITVLLESTGTAATIYSDRQGNTELTAPYFADSDGFFQFFAAPGDYRITAEDSGTGFTRTWRYVPLFSYDSDITTSTGTQTLAAALDDRLISQASGDTAGTAALRDAIGAGDLYSRGGILGTVSQSGGVPTGAIIERGSNSDGEYVKFADGTLQMIRRDNHDFSTTGPADYTTPVTPLRTQFAASIAYLRTNDTNRQDAFAGTVVMAGNGTWRVANRVTVAETLGIFLFASDYWY